MKAIVFYCVYPLIWGLSKCPMGFLYVIADFLYYLVYYVFKYRRGVVRSNLKNSFPNYSEAQILHIEKKFYLFFCDFLVETIKFVSITEKELKQFIHLKDNSLMEQLYTQNRNVIGALGHCGNWEWASPYFSFYHLHQLQVIYSPLSNPYFEKFIAEIRTRFGAHLIKMNEVPRKMLMMQKNATANFTIFVADQTPSPDNAFWIPFLHQDTPFFRGMEILARKFNMPVLFISIFRPQRGRYNIEYEILSEYPQAEKEGEITLKFAKKLEQNIQAQPEIWLWSHRRWKHKR